MSLVSEQRISWIAQSLIRRTLQNLQPVREYVISHPQFKTWVRIMDVKCQEMELVDGFRDDAAFRAFVEQGACSFSQKVISTMNEVDSPPPAA